LTAEPDGCIIRTGMTTPPSLSEGVSLRLGAGALIVTGLLLVLAATIGPLPGPAGDPGAKVVIRLPDAVRAIVLGLLALSAIILFSLQRRRPTEEMPAPSRVVQRLPPWAATLLSLLPVLLVVLAWYLVWRYWSGPDGQPIEKAFAAIAGLLDLLALPQKPPTSIPSLEMAIAALLLLLALAVFAVMVLVALADRLEKWWTEREGAALLPAIPEALALIQADLRAEPDARVAIIRAYGRFERALAAARAPRAVWQTPAEFMRSTLARLPVASAPVRRLTALFEVARFSTHPLGAEARDAACDSLDEIGTALEEEAVRER
jgi:multisubunit Na+/H+ antiporter MnhB subunit